MNGSGGSFAAPGQVKRLNGAQWTAQTPQTHEEARKLTRKSKAQTKARRA